MFEIKTREVPARRLMSIQRRQHGDQTDAFVAEAKAAFAAHLGPVAPAGPFTLIFHGPVNDQADGPIEAAARRTGRDRANRPDRIRTEPAHTEAYTTITKRQWDYPAILAAYDAVACSPQATARPIAALMPRGLPSRTGRRWRRRADLRHRLPARELTLNPKRPERRPVHASLRSPRRHPRCPRRAGVWEYDELMPITCPERDWRRHRVRAARIV